MKGVVNQGTLNTRKQQTPRGQQLSFHHFLVFGTSHETLHGQKSRTLSPTSMRIGPLIDNFKMAALYTFHRAESTRHIFCNTAVKVATGAGACLQYQ